jgi:O-antigen/teichoic acid export membrane protein
MTKNRIKVLISKYNNLSAGAKASLWFVFCNILQRGISLLTTPIFTRLLSKEQFGMFNVYTSWYNIVAIFTTLHLSASVYTKGLIKFEDKRDEFTSSMIGLSSTATLIFTGIYLIFRSQFDNWFGLPTVCILAMFAESLFYPAYTFWSAKEKVDYKYKKVVLFTLVMSIASPVLGVICVKATEYKVEARILSFVFVQVIMGAIMYIALMWKGKKFFSRQYWKYALTFNLPLIPHYLSLIILQQSDKIMIEKLTGAGDAALYSIAYTIGQMLLLVTNAINYSYIPFAYRALKDGNEKSLGKRSVQLLYFVAASLIIVICIGPELLKLISTPEYHEAIWVIPLVAAASFFQYFYNLFTVVEYHFEKTVFVMIVSVASAILNIVLNYIFIKQYGYIAAAYTTLFCYLLTGISHYMFARHIYCKNTGKKWFINDYKAFLPAVVVIVMMFVMLFLYNYSIVRYCLLGLIIVLCIVFHKRLAVTIRKMLSKG